MPAGVYTDCGGDEHIDDGRMDGFHGLYRDDDRGAVCGHFSQGSEMGEDAGAEYSFILNYTDINSRDLRFDRGLVFCRITKNHLDQMYDPDGSWEGVPELRLGG